MNDATLILRRAKNLIKKYGWCQNSHFYNKKYSIVGAINYIMFKSVYGPRSYNEWDNRRIILEYLSRSLNIPSYKSITQYNDTKGRTKQQVLHTFDRAIQLLQEK